MVGLVELSGIANKASSTVLGKFPLDFVGLPFCVADTEVGLVDNAC